MRSAAPRAIRNKSHEGLSGPGAASDCKNPFKMMMATGPRPYPHPQDMAAAHHHQQLQLQHQQQQQDLYSGYQRQRLASGEPGPKSPYRSGGLHHHTGMLSPTSGGPQAYGDSPLSPRTDSLGSPDAFARAGNPCAFQGGGSPGSLHGTSRTPLSPPAVMLQSSCAMAGRTNTPLSPNTTKSPIMKKPMCNFPPGMDMPRAVFHHGKSQPAPNHPTPSAPAMPPTCILQKKPMSSEKDPLGILDPIPSKPVNPNPMPAPNSSSYPPGVHSQVPMMNVNIPPAIVPLPSNLPLPTVKPGPVGHGGHMQRTQPTATGVISPSPVTSPVHVSAPPHGRLDSSSPQRSRSSSTSSDHGSFAVPSGPQAPCGGMKVPPRSPRSSLGSPRPAMPSSPSSAKSDALHQYKDVPNQLLAGMGNTLSAPHNSMFPPPPTSASSACGTGGGGGGAGGSGNPQKNHPGLLGMPLNQILNQQNAASFPASSLLSAAAKAQLANQNKMGGGGAGSGGSGGGMGGGGGHPCSNAVDGHSTLNPMLPPPSSAMLLNSVPESGQSGRAALRDKLMAQQRDPLRKRKQSSGSGAASGGGGTGTSHHDSMVFNMLKPDIAGHPRMAGGPHPPAPPPAGEQLRKAPSRLAGLPPNTSMAQLLQSMSSQNSHMAQTARMGPGSGMAPGPGGLGPAQMHFGDGVMSAGPGHQNLQAQQQQQRLHGPTDGMRCPSMDPGGPAGQMPYGGGMMNQLQASAMGGSGPMGQGGQLPMGNPSMGHPGGHPQQLSYLQQQQQHQQQQQGHPLSHGRANVSGMMLSSNDGSCVQAISESGKQTVYVNQRTEF